MQCHTINMLQSYWLFTKSRRDAPAFMHGEVSRVPYLGRGLGLPCPIDIFLNAQFTCSMKQTMLLKLNPTEEQHRALLDTMHAFNAAANYVAEIAFSEKTANKFELQKLVYGELRTTYKLAAQLAIRCISKTSEAYKRD